MFPAVPTGQEFQLTLEVNHIHDIELHRKTYTLEPKSWAVPCHSDRSTWPILTNWEAASAAGNMLAFAKVVTTTIDQPAAIMSGSTGGNFRAAEKLHLKTVEKDPDSKPVNIFKPHSAVSSCQLAATSMQPALCSTRHVFTLLLLALGWSGASRGCSRGWRSTSKARNFKARMEICFHRNRDFPEKDILKISGLGMQCAQCFSSWDPRIQWQISLSDLSGLQMLLGLGKFAGIPRPGQGASTTPGHQGKSASYLPGSPEISEKPEMQVENRCTAKSKRFSRPLQRGA